MSRSIAVIFIGVVETITSAEEQATNGKQYGQYRQNYFEIEHILGWLNKMTLAYILDTKKCQGLNLQEVS